MWKDVTKDQKTVKKHKIITKNLRSPCNTFKLTKDKKHLSIHSKYIYNDRYKKENVKFLKIICFYTVPPGVGEVNKMI